MSRNWRSQGLARSGLALMIVFAVLQSGACGGKSPPNTVPSAAVAAEPLLTSLTNAVPGLSHTQSMLGAGALFGLAKTKMPSDQFGQISKAIPGTDGLVNEAVHEGFTRTPAGLSDVTEFLAKKEAVTPTQASQLTAALDSAVQSNVPADVASSFRAALQ